MGPVVFRHRHPQPGGAGAGDRLFRADRVPGRPQVPGLRRASVHHLRPHRRHPCGHHQSRQPARLPGQPGKPQPGQRLPALGRAHRPGQGQGRVQYLVPRPGRGRAAGRRDRGGQHHGHLRPRTPVRDRAAPGAGRPGSPPVPQPPPSTPATRAGLSSSPRRPGPAASPPPWPSAPSPGCCPRSAPPACPPPRPYGPCDLPAGPAAEPRTGSPGPRPPSRHRPANRTTPTITRPSRKP